MLQTFRCQQEPFFEKLPCNHQSNTFLKLLSVVIYLHRGHNLCYYRIQFKRSPHSVPLFHSALLLLCLSRAFLKHHPLFFVPFLIGQKIQLQSSHNIVFPLVPIIQHSIARQNNITCNILTLELAPQSSQNQDLDSYSHSAINFVGDFGLCIIAIPTVREDPCILS